MCARSVFTIFCYWISMVHWVFASNIAPDYYFGEDALRTEENMCGSSLVKLLCRSKCGEQLGLCLNDRCYCIANIAIEGSGTSHYSERIPTKVELLYLDRPALRHHIAHFCENLDTARTCIRKCMKEGKPAFCGKDHNCYCGHRYHNNSKDNKQDAKNMYAAFQDMYAKYFGPNTDFDSKNDSSKGSKKANTLKNNNLYRPV